MKNQEKTTTNPTRKELKEAIRAACTELRTAVPLSNGWFVKAEKIYPQPARVGPAWFYVYYVVSPTGKQFGGQQRADSLVSDFCNPYAFQWVDDYKGNGYSKGGAQ